MIHRNVGLLLQAQSEERGRTEAHLTPGQLARIIEERLKEQGHEGEGLVRLKAKILKAATERLVFLVGLEDGRVGFEIRSLQEFMAGEALASAADDLVRKRLHHLAASPHWRNVFLFVAGRCFTDREYLAESVFTVCSQLNDSGSDKTLGITRAGSRLALEVLEDGAARAKPGIARLLAREALQFLELPEYQEHERLVDCDEEPLRSQYEEAAGRALRGGWVQGDSAWTLLLGLARRQIRWAAEVATEHWPTEASALRGLVRVASRSFDKAPAQNPWRDKIIAALPQLSPRDAALMRRFHPAPRKQPSMPEWLDAAVGFVGFGGRRMLRLQLTLGDQGTATTTQKLALAGC